MRAALKEKGVASLHHHQSGIIISGLRWECYDSDSATGKKVREEISAITGHEGSPCASCWNECMGTETVDGVDIFRENRRANLSE